MPPRVLFIGPRQVGKTSLFRQLSDESDFDAMNVEPTCDVTTQRHHVQIGCKATAVDVIDAPNICHNKLLGEVDGVVLVIDSSNTEPLKTQLKRVRLAGLPLLVVFNKRDVCRDFETPDDIEKFIGVHWDPAWSFVQTCGLDSADDRFLRAFDEFCELTVHDICTPRSGQRSTQDFGHSKSARNSKDLERVGRSVELLPLAEVRKHSSVQ